MSRGELRDALAGVAWGLAMIAALIGIYVLAAGVGVHDEAWEQRMREKECEWHRGKPSWESCLAQAEPD